MALVHSQVLTLTFNVQDDDLARSDMTFYATLPAINQWTQDAIDKVKEEMWDLIDPLVDSGLIGVNAILSSYDDTFPAGAAGSDVENKGVFLLTAEGNNPGSLSLASILEAKLVDTGIAAGIQIDVADTDVAAFTDALINGIDLNPFGILDTVKFGTSRGEDWGVVRDAYKQNRKSHKSRGGRG